jgi:hypothetical protein
MATELRAGRSGDRIPVGTRFSAPVQTGPGAHPASCTMGTGSFPGVESGWGVTLAPHPLLVPRSKAIPLLSLRAFVACNKGKTYLEIANEMHKFAPLLYSYMLAPTCFGSILPSSGSFWIRLSYVKIQIDTYRLYFYGLAHNFQPANSYKCTQLTPKAASVVPPEDRRLTLETCRGLRHNKVFVKVKVY